MRATPIFIILFLISACANAGSQLLLKNGAPEAARQLTLSQNIFLKVFKAITTPSVFVAVLMLATGMLLWLYLISRFDLSQAYPVNIGLTVVITTIAAAFLFREPVTLIKVVGIALVLFGVWLLLQPQAQQ